MKYTVAVVAVAVALGGALFLAGVKSPSVRDLKAVTETRWLDEVARVAFKQTHIGAETPDWLKREGITPEIAARITTLDTNVIRTVDGPRRSDSFPNINLLDQHGRTLRFYDDIVKDRSVCIVFFYTRCSGSCPGTTVTLKHLREMIASEFPGEEFKFVSLTLEPEVDTSEELQEYIDRYHIKESLDLPEWIFATGDYEELDGLRRELGVYDLDPIIDADKTEHAAIVTFGNDRTDRWAALPVGMGVNKVAETVVRIAGNSHRQRYASTVFPGHVALDAACTAASRGTSCCRQKSGKSCCAQEE